jgi:hypothetical protein
MNTVTRHQNKPRPLLSLSYGFCFYSISLSVLFKVNERSNYTLVYFIPLSESPIHRTPKERFKGMEYSVLVHKQHCVQKS